MKKIFAILSLCLMAMGMVFANGSTDGDSGAVAAQKYEVIEGLDMGGRVIKLVDWWGGGPADEDEQAKIDYLEQTYNFELKFVNSGDWAAHHADLSASVMMGMPLGDFVYIDAPYFLGLVKENMLTPVDGMGVDFSQSYYHQIKRKAFTFNGREYGMKQDYKKAEIGWWFNKSLLEREGYDADYIYQLMERGEWNWDNMLEIAQSVTKDLDGDGTIDQWGFAEDVQHTLALALIAGNGGNIVDVDGNFVLDSPQAIEALQMYQDLNLKYKVLGMRPSDDVEWTWAYSEFGAGNVAFLPHYVFCKANWMGDVQDEIGWALFPAGPQGEMTSGSVPNETVAIPAGVEDVENLILIWDQLVKPNAQFGDLDRDPYAGLYKEFDDLESVELTQHLVSEEGMWTLFNYRMFNVSSDWEMLPYAILRGEKAPAVAVEEVKPVFEGKIAEALATE